VRPSLDARLRGNDNQAAPSRGTQIAKKSAKKKPRRGTPWLRIEWPQDQAAAAALASVGTEAIVFKICEAIW
jgi:hypothetical protein